MAVIPNVELTNTFDTWRTRTNVGFTRLNAFAIDESKLYANTITANVRFVSTGATRLGTTGSNRTIVNGLLTANGNLSVAGNTTLGGASKTLTIGGSSSTLTIGGAGATVNATGWFGVTGRASVSTNLHVSGNTSVMSRLGVGSITPSTKLDVLGPAGVTSFTGTTQLGMVTRGSTGATDYSGIDFIGNSQTNPTGRIAVITAAGGSQLEFGVSGSYASGITVKGLTINYTGLVTVPVNLTVNNRLTTGNTTLAGTTTDNSNALNQTLTDQATIAWDTSLGRVATVTLGGARAMAAATNQKVGTYILRVVQDGTGGRTLTWNGNYKWTAQTAPVLSTAIGAVDIITFFSDGSKMYGSYLPDMR
jgi:hypothetical protein